MLRKERPFCDYRERGQHEVSQKVEFRPDNLDYLPRDDFFPSSLVFISNSGGPVYNSRADGYGGGRCSVFRLTLIIRKGVKEKPVGIDNYT